MLHLIARKETAEMERGGSEAIVDEPTAHLANHVHIVVDGGDDEVREFYPDAGIPHGKDGVEDWLQMATTEMLINRVAEGFQVDIGSIEIRQQVGKGLLADVTSRHKDVP